uniref:SFRICE_004450 n=1 Tax=Spodoptera frugiperda TaxID=7108 RepID=A0A2H1VG87_SPOFR
MVSSCTESVQQVPGIARQHRNKRHVIVLNGYSDTNPELAWTSTITANWQWYANHMNRIRGTHWPQVTWREHWARNNTEVVHKIIADIHKNCYACNNPAFGMTMKVEFRNRNNVRSRPDHLRAAPEIVRAPRRPQIPATATTTTTSQQAGEIMNRVQTVNNNERDSETGAIDRKNKNVGRDLHHRFRLETTHKCGNIHPERTYANPSQVEGSPDTSSWDEEDPSTWDEPGTGAATPYPHAVPSSYWGVDQGRGRGQDLLKRLKLWPNNNSSTSHPEKTVKLTDDHIALFSRSGSSPTQVEGSPDTSSWDEEDPFTWDEPGTGAATPYPHAVPSSYWGVDQGRGRGQDLLKRLKLWPNNNSSTSHPEKTVKLTDDHVASFSRTGSSPTQVEGSPDTSSWDEEDPSAWAAPGTSSTTPFSHAVPSLYWGVGRGRGRGQDFLNRDRKWSCSSGTSSWDEEDPSTWDEPGTGATTPYPPAVPSSCWEVERGRGRGRDMLNRLKKIKMTEELTPGDNHVTPSVFEDLHARDEPITSGVNPCAGFTPLVVEDGPPCAGPSSSQARGSGVPPAYTIAEERRRGHGRGKYGATKRTPRGPSSSRAGGSAVTPALEEPSTINLSKVPAVPFSSRAGASAVTPALEEPSTINLSTDPALTSSQAGNFGNLSAEDQPSTSGVAQYNGQASSSSQARVLTSDESSSSDETPCTSPGLASSREVVRDPDQSTTEATPVTHTEPAIDYWDPSRWDGVDDPNETPSYIPPENVMRIIAALNAESRIRDRERENFFENLQRRLIENLNVQFNMAEILLIFGNPPEEGLLEMLYVKLLGDQTEDASPGSGSGRRNYRDEYKKKKRGDKF